MTGRPTDRRAAVIAGHTGDLDAARAAIRSVDRGVRGAALGALARLGELDAATLLAGLRDPDASVVRRAATLAARRTITDNAVEEAALDSELLALLGSDRDALAEVAAWALGERFENAADAVAGRAVAALAAAATGHADALVREAAVAALGSIGDPNALPAVLAAAGDKATVRRRAVIALAAFEGPDVDAALAHARTDRDWQVRQAAEDLT